MPPTFKQHTLPNGLRIVAEIDPTSHSAAAGFYVRTGARDENPSLMGVSHFLEHMMFKGTEDITAEQLNRKFDEIGARNNAFTSGEMTCFYAHFLPEYAPSGIELLGRMMRPALRQRDFETEKNVILEEIAMYRDNPFWVLYEACLERHFPNHPLGHRVLGTPETITSLSSDQMRDYFGARYSADNTIVSLAGRIDFAATVAQIEELCGNWQATHVSRDTRVPSAATTTLELSDEKVSRAYLLAISPGPAFADERRYAAMLLAQALGAPDNSLLHWALIETGLAEDAQASYSAHDGYGEFFVFASGDPDRADEIADVLQREVANAVASVSEEDLVRLRNRVLTAATVGGERPLDRMHRLGQVYTQLGAYLPLEAELAAIDRVTLEDIRETAEAFPLAGVTSGRLVPASAVGAS